MIILNRFMGLTRKSVFLTFFAILCSPLYANQINPQREIEAPRLQIKEIERLHVRFSSYILGPGDSSDRIIRLTRAKWQVHYWTRWYFISATSTVCE